MLKKLLILFCIFSMLIGVKPAYTFSTIDEAEKAYKTLRNTIVHITVEYTAEVLKITQTRFGSGVIIQPSGIIVTNAHLFRDVPQFKIKTVTVETFDHEKFSIPSNQIWVDDEADLAEIHIDHTFSDYATIDPIDFEGITNQYSDSDLALDKIKEKIGKYVLVIGHPYNIKWRRGTGTINSPSRYLEDLPYPLIDLDIHINPGNSGGGLFANGKLIGIPEITIVGAGIGFAIPIKRFCDLRPDSCAKPMPYQKSAPQMPFSTPL